MKETPPDMKVRLSADLREKIGEAARANNRTLNSEIVFRLEASFRQGDEAEPGWLEKAQASPRVQIEKRLLKLELDVERLQNVVATLKSESE